MGKIHEDLYPDIYGLYLYFLDKGYSRGLTSKDLIAIKKVIQDIDNNDDKLLRDDKWQELHQKFINLKMEMYNSGMFYKYDEDSVEYLIENTYILPLVLANAEPRKIKMYSDAGYYFSCQFHRENTPSMGVMDDRNFFHCWGCGASGSAINYLMEYESISFQEAIELLSMIYIIDPKMKNDAFKEQLKKYQSAIISQEYRELLEMGEKRLKRRNQTSINHESVEDFYQKRYAMIDRIKNNKYDYKFPPKKYSRIMYLDD